MFLEGLRWGCVGAGTNRLIRTSFHPGSQVRVKYNAVPAGLLKIVKYSSECSGDAN